MEPLHAPGSLLGSHRPALGRCGHSKEQEYEKKANSIRDAELPYTPPLIAKSLTGKKGQNFAIKGGVLWLAFSYVRVIFDTHVKRFQGTLYAQQP